MSKVPHITGIITYPGPYKNSVFKINGPLDKELKRIMDKYGSGVLPVLMFTLLGYYSMACGLAYFCLIGLTMI